MLGEHGLVAELHQDLRFPRGRRLIHSLLNPQESGWQRGISEVRRRKAVSANKHSSPVMKACQAKTQEE